MENFRIEVDDHIELLPPVPEYAKPLYEILNSQRTYLGHWLPWAKNTKGTSDLRKFLNESMLFNTGGQRFTTFIFYKGEIAGSIGFVRIDK